MLEVLDDRALFDGFQVLAGLAFLVLALRIALLLGATPVGAMRREILYVRADMFRPLVQLTVAFLALEGAQFVLPWLAPLVGLGGPWPARVHVVLDAAQAVMLVVIAAGTLRAFNRYSRRSLEDLEVFARRGIEAVARRVGRARPEAGRRRA